ncbi:MAG: tetratricopeptide repeat protein [Sphingomonadales bacterium]|nr:MAG: tetratricopeptide repeat protein [Sphingomonadales bacterium]
MRFALLSIVAAPLLLAALPATAGERAISALIAAGAYQEAEQAIRSELRIYPSRPELLLNLAAVYVKSGRTAEARTLYSQVLAQREVLMDLRADKVAGSHAVASVGLRQVRNVQLSAR